MSDIQDERNPYAPPAKAADEGGSAPLREYSGIGVFNDQGTLVLSREQHQFPNVCMKSGEPTEDHVQLDEVRLPRSKATAGLAITFGFIGLQIAKGLYGQHIVIDIPMRSDWVDPSEEKSKRGWKVVWWGLGLIIAGIILSVFSEAMIGLCLIGMIVGIVGLILGGVKSTNAPFSVSDFNDHYVWVQGADRSVVEKFEVLPSIAGDEKYCPHCERVIAKTTKICPRCMNKLDVE